MRTAKEIRQYLKQQRWYNDFVHNTRVRYKDRRSKYIIRGYCKKDTIGCAFLWDHTPQDHEYWEAIYYRFKKWYDKGVKKYERL